MSRANSGFTMIELLVTVAIIGILASIAVPGMQGYLARSRLDRVVSNLQADAAYARGEALRRQRTVSICPAEIKPNMSGDISCNGGDWNQGWVVFSDPTTGVVGVIENQTDVLRVREGATGAVVNPQSGTLVGAASIQFVPSGTASVAGVIRVCPAGLSRGMDVNLSRGGRTSRAGADC